MPLFLSVLSPILFFCFVFLPILFLLFFFFFHKLDSMLFGHRVEVQKVMVGVTKINKNFLTKKNITAFNEIINGF